MAKFEFLCAKDRVAVIKIGESIYYLDLDDHFDIKVYDTALQLQNIIIPEFWISEVTRGQASISIINACVVAYSNGFSAGYSIKANRCFVDFVHKLKKALLDPETASLFLQLFWIELRPFEVIKKLVSKIISNQTIREKTPAASRITLDRYEIRARHEDDNEFSDIIYRIQNEMEEAVFDPTNQLLDILEVRRDKTPLLIENIDKIVNSRESK